MDDFTSSKTENVRNRRKKSRVSLRNPKARKCRTKIASRMLLVHWKTKPEKNPPVKVGYVNSHGQRIPLPSVVQFLYWYNTPTGTQYIAVSSVITASQLYLVTIMQEFLPLIRYPCSYILYILLSTYQLDVGGNKDIHRGLCLYAT